MATTTTRTTTKTAAPMPPSLAPRRAGESAHTFGLRAFAFVINEGVIGVDSEALELALHASHGIVTAPDLLPSTRETLTQRRLDILSMLAARQRQADEVAQLEALATAKPEPPAEPKGKGKGNGGPRVPRRRPQPVMPPGGAFAPL